MSFHLHFLLLCVLLSSCATPWTKKGLVDVRRTIPDIKIDLRYATAKNVTGRPLYPRRMPCLLRASTAEKLKRAQALLHAQGYGLKIWDAWRPLEAHQVLFSRGYETGMFQDPSYGWSRHCGGISVDATLVDLKGREQRMPTYFDEDLAHASSLQQPKDPEIRRNLNMLHGAMKAAGFYPLREEWWHFDDMEFLFYSIPVIQGKDIGIKILKSKR